MAKGYNDPFTLEQKPGEKKELNLSRSFDARRELLFKSWTDKNYFPKWWGPNGFTTPVCDLEVRAGGNIYIEMQGPDGERYPSKGNFREILEPRRIVFSMAPLDENGNALFETLNTVTLEDDEGRARLSLHIEITKITEKAAPYLQGIEQGWSQTLDRLSKFTAN